MTGLAEVGDLRREALQLLDAMVASNPTSDVAVIQEFAAIARVREIARQLGWRSELAELNELYAIRGDQVRAIIAKEVQ